MSNLATFKLNDQHHLVLTTDKVKCETCSLSDVTAKAVLFMYKNGVIKMIVDGAEIKRT